MADDRWQTFAPLPARAMADEALAALDIRVLACLAAHDRFGANGIGCYASHLRLSGLVKCHLKSLSRSLRLLAELGYIEASQHPLNKRLRVYRVVYLPGDKAVMKGGIGNEPVTDTDPIGNHPVLEDGPIGNQHFQESEQLQEDAGVNILGEALSIASETVKDNSVETALLRTNRTGFTRQDSDGQFLGRLQTWLRVLDGVNLTSAEVLKLQQKRDRCTELEDLHGIEQIGGWAQRLGTDIDILLDESRDEDDEPHFDGGLTRFAVVRGGIPIRVGVRTTMRRNPEAWAA